MGLLDKVFGRPSKAKFARLLEHAIRQAGETIAIRYDAEEFRFVTEADEKRLFNLTNIYREYCATPSAKRGQALRHYVRSWFANRKGIPAAFEDAVFDLLPSVRNRCQFEISALQAQFDGLPALDWPHRVLADHLTVSLVYALPEVLMQVQRQHLANWGRSFEEAEGSACDNLRKISDRQWQTPIPGLWISPWRDNHDASRLVLTDVIQALAVKGAHVAMVPNRDELFVTGSEDERGLAHLVALAENSLEHPRLITGFAFLLDNWTWRPWLPDAGHPLHDRFHLLQLQSFGRDYAAQKDVLDALHEKTEQNLWVASYSAVKSEATGKMHSYCVWSRGVEALLPETEQVYFVIPTSKQEGEVVARATWDRVQWIVGDLIERQKGYPVRYRTKRFPSPEERALLGSGS
jgi:hypothetical protein